jgi:hypothetical protein
MTMMNSQSPDEVLRREQSRVQDSFTAIRTMSESDISMRKANSWIPCNMSLWK